MPLPEEASRKRPKRFATTEKRYAKPKIEAREAGRDARCTTVKKAEAPVEPGPPSELMAPREAGETRQVDTRAHEERLRRLEALEAHRASCGPRSNVRNVPRPRRNYRANRALSRQTGRRILTRSRNIGTATPQDGVPGWN